MDADRINVITGRAPLRASSAVRSALAQRGKGVGSISYFYSPKNERDFVVSSDLEFYHFLHLEGSDEVQSYDLDPDRVSVYLVGRGYVESKPDAVVHLFNGTQRIVEVKYQHDLEHDIRTSLQIAVQQRAAAKAGMEWRSYTDHMVVDEEPYLHDWLSIVTVLTATAPYLSERLERRVLQVFESHEPPTLVQLRDLALDQWSLVFATAFRLCQKRLLKHDLRDHRLSPKTRISWGSP